MAPGFSISEDGTLALQGRLTLDTVGEVYGQTAETLRDPDRVRAVDLAGVTDVDSAGLALLLEWQAARRDRGNALRIGNAPDSLVSLARLHEASELLNLTGRTA